MTATVTNLPTPAAASRFDVHVDHNNDVHLTVDEATADALDQAWARCREAGLLPRKRPTNHLFTRTAAEDGSGDHLFCVDAVTAEQLAHAWCWANTGEDGTLPHGEPLLQFVQLATAAGQAAHALGLLHPPALATVPTFWAARPVTADA